MHVYTSCLCIGITLFTMYMHTRKLKFTILRIYIQLKLKWCLKNTLQIITMHVAHAHEPKFHSNFASVLWFGSHGWNPAITENIVISYYLNKCSYICSIIHIGTNANVITLHCLKNIQIFMHSVLLHLQIFKNLIIKNRSINFQGKGKSPTWKLLSATIKLIQQCK